MLPLRVCCARGAELRTRPVCAGGIPAGVLRLMKSVLQEKCSNVHFITAGGGHDGGTGRRGEREIGGVRQQHVQKITACEATQARSWSDSSFSVPHSSFQHPQLVQFITASVAKNVRCRCNLRGLPVPHSPHPSRRRPALPRREGVRLGSCRARSAPPRQFLANSV